MHIINMAITVVIDLGPWLWYFSSGLSTVVLLFLFPLMLQSLGEGHCAQPTFQVLGLCSSSLRLTYRHRSFRLLPGRFSSSPPYISLLNHLFISLWTQRYCFYTELIVCFFSWCNIFYFKHFFKYLNNIFIQKYIFFLFMLTLLHF